MPKRTSEVVLEDLSGDEHGRAPEKKRSRLGDATNRLQVGGAQARVKQELLTQQQKASRQQDGQDGEEPASKSDDEGDLLDAEDQDAHIQEVLQRKMDEQQHRAGVCVQSIFQSKSDSNEIYSGLATWASSRRSG